MELGYKGATYTISVKTVSFGGGGDEYLVTISREDRVKRETFVDGDFNAKLNNGAMFAVLEDLYVVKRRGKESRELGFDKPVQNDAESRRAYQRRVRKFNAEVKWANKRYNAVLSELERIILKKTKNSQTRKSRAR